MREKIKLNMAERDGLKVFNYEDVGFETEQCEFATVTSQVFLYAVKENSGMFTGCIEAHNHDSDDSELFLMTTNEVFPEERLARVKIQDMYLSLLKDGCFPYYEDIEVGKDFSKKYLN